MGDSRAWFDLDLDELQKGLGKRPHPTRAPRLLRLAGPLRSGGRQNFHGTVICSFVPVCFSPRPASPPMRRAKTDVRRFHNQTPAQRASEIWPSVGRARRIFETGRSQSRGPLE